MLQIRLSLSGLSPMRRMNDESTNEIKNKDTTSRSRMDRSTLSCPMKTSTLMVQRLLGSTWRAYGSRINGTTVQKDRYGANEHGACFPAYSFTNTHSQFGFLRRLWYLDCCMILLEPWWSVTTDLASGCNKRRDWGFSWIWVGFLYVRVWVLEFCKRWYTWDSIHWCHYWCSLLLRAWLIVF